MSDEYSRLQPIEGEYVQCCPCLSETCVDGKKIYPKGSAYFFFISDGLPFISDAGEEILATWAAVCGDCWKGVESSPEDYEFDKVYEWGMNQPILQELDDEKESE